MDAAAITKAFSESTFVLLSSIVSFAGGVYMKHLHQKHVVEQDEPESEQFLLNPTLDIKYHDLAKELGELKAKVAALEAKNG